MNHLEEKTGRVKETEGQNSYSGDVKRKYTTAYESLWAEYWESEKKLKDKQK